MDNYLLKTDYKNILNNIISIDEKNRLNWHENTKQNGWIGYNGNAWKAVPLYRKNRDYTVFTVPDAGVSIISTDNIEKLKKPKLSITENIEWSDYFNNFHDLMNPYTFEYFEKTIKEHYNVT